MWTNRNWRERHHTPRRIRPPPLWPLPQRPPPPRFRPSFMRPMAPPRFAPGCLPPPPFSPRLPQWLGFRRPGEGLFPHTPCHNADTSYSERPMVPPGMNEHPSTPSNIANYPEMGRLGQISHGTGANNFAENPGPVNHVAQLECQNALRTDNEPVSKVDLAALMEKQTKMFLQVLVAVCQGDGSIKAVTDTNVVSGEINSLVSISAQAADTQPNSEKVWDNLIDKDAQNAPWTEKKSEDCETTADDIEDTVEVEVVDDFCFETNGMVEDANSQNPIKGRYDDDLIPSDDIMFQNQPQRIYGWPDSEPPKRKYLSIAGTYDFHDYRIERLPSPDWRKQRRKRDSKSPESRHRHRRAERSGGRRSRWNSYDERRHGRHERRNTYDERGHKRHERRDTRRSSSDRRRVEWKEAPRVSPTSRTVELEEGEITDHVTSVVESDQKEMADVEDKSADMDVEIIKEEYDSDCFIIDGNGDLP